MKKFAPGSFTALSSSFAVPKKDIKGYIPNLSKQPAVGDLVYGEIQRVGQHSTLENRAGRIHQIDVGNKAVFTFGNRYAPDHFEGVVPKKLTKSVDLLARSGVVGRMRCRNAMISDPTIISVLGYVCDKDSKPVNTTNYCLINPQRTIKNKKRSKMILVVGTSMNSGKSAAACMCCRALTAAGKCVRASKITGTASLKDILHMQDSGAQPICDFTYFGYPSTYLMEQNELLHIFNQIDLKYCNNANNYWVVEIADGILQRETATLLDSDDVKNRIHKLVFTSVDALGAHGGIEFLESEFGLSPNIISGVVSSSPLASKELVHRCDVEVVNSLSFDFRRVSEILE